MSENGFVLISGKSAAAQLFGSALPECGVVYAEKVVAADCPDCAVIVGENGEIPTVKRAAGMIINGDSGETLPNLTNLPNQTNLPTERLSGVQIITCGRCAKNTVCVTSNDGETLTLALNRGITTLRGFCEPMELPVKRTAASEYDCMAAFAAAVLLGRLS